LESVARFAGGGFELVQLRVALGGIFSTGRVSVEFRAGAVVEGGVRVDPHLRVGVALVFGSLGRVGETHADEKFIEGGKSGIGSGILALGCGSTGPDSCGGAHDRTIPRG